jgi:hypothetical protein
MVVFKKKFKKHYDFSIYITTFEILIEYIIPGNTRRNSP